MLKSQRTPAKKITCGPDVERFIAKIKEIQALGLDRISVHQAESE